MLKNALVIAVLVLGGAAVFGTSCGSNTTCPAGARRCACTAVGACDTGLTCSDNVCVSMSVPTGMGGMTGNGGAGGSTQQGGKSGGGGSVSTGGQGGGQNPGLCTSSPTDNECVMCADQMCCAELNGCQNTPECVALFNCLGPCADGDTACVDACAAAHQPGISAINALFKCLDTKCPSTCGPPDGGAGGATGAGGSPHPVGDGGANVCANTANTTACGVCVHNNCCSTFTACTNTPACASFGDCVDMCAAGDTACENTCATKFPAGVAPLDALNVCGNANCKAACM
jgi:hypothetical protein